MTNYNPGHPFNPLILVQTTCLALLDVIFPNRCIACDAEMQTGEKCVCTSCWQSIPRIVQGEATINVLRRRFEESGIIEHIFSPFYFDEEGALQKIIHGLKYEGFTHPGIVGGRLTGELIAFGDLPVKIDCIIPVPLHRSKHRERGYNQSEYIAKGIAKEIGVYAIETSAVRRIRPTQTQTHLSIDDRKSNIRGAFRVVRPERVSGRHVLIVDDVITTGATVGECAKAVKNAGATSVSAASIALARLGSSFTFK